MRLLLLSLAVCGVSLSQMIMAPARRGYSPRHIRGSSNPSDEELLAETVEIDRQLERQRSTKKVHRRGAVGKLLEDEVNAADFKKSNFKSVDDYSDFDTKDIANRGEPDNLETVTFKPAGAEDGRPKLSDSEIAVGKKGWGLQDGETGKRPNRPNVAPLKPLRTGYYFQHYPWYLLPRAYRMRPTYPYVYPPQFQKAQWAYTSQLPQNYDPYAVYSQTKNARDNYNAYLASAYGGGGGSQGGFGGRGFIDTEDFDHDDDDNDEEARDGEVELSKKKDPLDDLDLETLEKIDKMDKADHDEKFVLRAKALRARAIKA